MTFACLQAPVVDRVPRVDGDGLPLTHRRSRHLEPDGATRPHAHRNEIKS